MAAAVLLLKFHIYKYRYDKIRAVLNLAVLFLVILVHIVNRQL